MIESGDLILQYLEGLGVEYVFGVPGGSIEPFYNALARSQRRGGIRPVTARHETGAAFMADGYYRETGKLGVCCATAGPGTTNLLTGVATAFADNIPMLVISAQTPLNKFGQGALQESSCTSINTIDMMARCTRYNTLVSHPDQVEPKLLQALSYALGHRPGPVHLSVPLDIMRHPVPEHWSGNVLKPFVANTVVPDPESLRQLLDDLSTIDRATILVGEDAAGAADLLVQLAEQRNWKLVTTPRGKGLIDSYHPLYRGVFGFAGHNSATEALYADQCDRVIAVGTGLDEVTTAGWDSNALLSNRLIHLSPRHEHLSRSVMARLAILGDPRLALEFLLKAMADDRRDSAPLFPPTSGGLPAAIAKRRRASCLVSSGPIKPQALMTYLSRVCPDESRVLCDSGNSFLWGIHHWNVRRPAELAHDRSLFHMGIGFSPMAWAIGASVGVAAGAKGAPVICITGDGSFLMSGQELTTAKQENLNLLMVILNDSSLGMVRHGQALSGGEAIAHELPSVDYARLAEALGIESFRVESMEALQALEIETILKRPGPCLLDVVIDNDEVPPMGSRLRVLTGAA